jgi:hypothetical protein
MMSRRSVSAAFALAAVAALGLAGCRARPAGTEYTVPTMAAPVGAMSLDRGAWLVGTTKGLWDVTVPGDTPSSKPVRIGYVTAREHREVRGGPAFTIYEVTGLDRTSPVGIVDSLGNAKRFKPRVNGHQEIEDAGNSTLNFSVQAIFETTKPVTLTATTERKLAFELLDADGNGTLDATEFPAIAARRGSPDTNRDGKVDWNEFDADDDL